MMTAFESRNTSIDGFDVIELFGENQSARIVLDIGNTLYNWTWKGKKILWFPYSLDNYLNNEKECNEAVIKICHVKLSQMINGKISFVTFD